MLSSPHRRFSGPRALTTPLALTASLALAASVALAAAPVASGQSTAQPNGEITVSSLGSTNDVPGSVAGSVGGSLEALGSVGPVVYDSYVALGDSYAAFGDQRDLVPGSGQCARSTTNYPSALADLAEFPTVSDMTCGGAVVEDLFEEQHPDITPQFYGLAPDTDLITLSIGGNDVGFGQIVGCIAGHLPTQSPPNDCRALLDSTVRNSIDAVYGADGTINEAYEHIADKAPYARVVATQYMPLMPATDADAARCVFATAIGQANLDWAREITTAINTAVDQAARRHGHVSVMPTSDIDHSACAAPDVRWTQFLEDEPDAEDPTGAAAFHPTGLGQAAMADAVAAAL